ncbi:CRISPR-associated helicase Cas3 [Halalkaliarchaeum desulfuricum]|uniref:CRISPR-associated helicase Cas3 n=1 Tax=Halalkaliarchaeum desulfuricum TaxID=2055893 RepID=A0A343TGI1_9EURY|nr:type I-D CRISPR-associated helicase Cas3' [Halalkaliarchaeum desulfuricum]AUX08203.1 CRISPR-associated helicase Cas3 [Halalkaliarchaeum desulfuricum]
MTTLDLSGVALQTHDESYPFDVSPFAHQRELQRLFEERDRFVAVNDSPTGGGKTSSWLAPVFANEIDPIAIYPTNALIADQQEAIQRKVEETVDHDVAVLKATAATLSEKSDDFGPTSHGAVLDDWLRQEKRYNNQVILLTNPDIFVMMRRGLYRKGSREYKDFEVAVVDEFHRAGRKEQNTLRFLLDEMQAADEAVVALRKVAFLSATPDQRQERLFENAMEAPYVRVTDHDSRERKSYTESPGNEWYSVMPPVELDVRTAPTFGTGEILHEEAEDILRFCRSGRTVVMLDGIHEVGQVHAWLDEEIDGNVERIDGFYGENKAEKLARFDVLVSNSAVEVGIDFDVDRILFAGHNRESFLQRLGRLRSASDWKQARCYVPRTVANALSEYEGQTTTRSELDDILADAYPDPRQPATFDAKYSAAEAFEHLDDRLRNASSDDQQAIEQSTLDRIKRHFGVGPGADFSLQDMERFTETLDWRVLTSLQWYRGDNIQALVYDRTKDRVTTYDLFYLLRYGDVKFVDRDSFERLVPSDQRAKIDRRERYVDGFCVYDGTIETTDEGYGRSVYFTGGTLNAWIDDTSNTGRKPQLKSGLQIGVDPNGSGSRVPSITKVNARLRERGQRADAEESGLVCYAVNGPPSRVKRQYELDDFFFLYPIRIQNKDMHSLAIGIDALYLHCHVIEQEQQLSGSDDSDFLDNL